MRGCIPVTRIFVDLPVPKCPDEIRGIVVDNRRVIIPLLPEELSGKLCRHFLNPATTTVHGGEHSILYKDEYLSPILHCSTVNNRDGEICFSLPIGAIIGVIDLYRGCTVVAAIKVSPPNEPCLTRIRVYGMPGPHWEIRRILLPKHSVIGEICVSSSHEFCPLILGAANKPNTSIHPERSCFLNREYTLECPCPPVRRCE